VIAKAILIIAMLAVAAALVRALVVGRIEFNPAGSGMLADRATQPISFWTVFLIGISTIAFLAWLVFGA
jgi:hypothetical protein